MGVFGGATRGARNPNLQVFITHASHVCSRHSFGLPLKMNGMHRTQFDHISRETYGKHGVRAKAFGLSIVVVRTPQLLVITST